MLSCVLQLVTSRPRALHCTTQLTPITGVILHSVHCTPHHYTPTGRAGQSQQPRACRFLKAYMAWSSILRKHRKGRGYAPQVLPGLASSCMAPQPPPHSQSYAGATTSKTHVNRQHPWPLVCAPTGPCMVHCRRCPTKHSPLSWRQRWMTTLTPFQST